MNVLRQAIAKTVQPRDKANLTRILKGQEAVMQSLSHPQETIARAWTARDDARATEATNFLELLASNPDYECPDVELVLGYWQVQDFRFEEGLARIRNVAQTGEYQKRDLARFLVAWALLQQARLQETRLELERFMKTATDASYRKVARGILMRLERVTKGPAAGNGNAYGSTVAVRAESGKGE